MMKRIILIFTVLALAFSFVGCSEKPNKNQSTATTKSTGIFEKDENEALRYGNDMIRNGKRIGKISCLTQVLRAGKKCELELQISDVVGNVFDPAEVSLDIQLKKGKKTVCTPGFYYQAYYWNEDGRRATAVENGNAWRFRIVVPESGTWDYEITFSEDGTVKDSVKGYINFYDFAKDYKGFIKVSENDARFMAFANGEAYIPIGHNVGWSDVTRSYDYIYYRDIIRKLSENGGNFVRIWMCCWDLSLYSPNKAPNDFSDRLDNAIVLDRILDECADQGVYVELSLYHHGQFIASGTDAAWSTTSFNVNRKNGYLKTPDEFWENEKAIADTKCYLRYMVARYGYSSNILTWELCNEITSAAGENDVITEWCHQMAAYIRSIDANQHMVSASSARVDDSINYDKTFDIMNVHWYGYESFKSLITKISSLAVMYKKPIFIAEVGPSWEGSDGLNETVLHQQSWAGLMGSSAGTGCSWWWEAIDALKDDVGYKVYKPVSEMAKKIPFCKEKMYIVTPATAEIADERIGLAGYRTETALFLWIYDNTYTYTSTTAEEFDSTLIKAELSAGEYSVEWINSWTGETLKQYDISHSGGTLEISTPPWSKDIALTVTKK